MSETQKMHFLKQIVFYKPSNHCFSAGIGVFEKCPFLCPLFWKTLVGQKWCTLFFHNLNRTPKNSETTTFLQESGFCCKATNQFLLLGGENKLFGGTLVFFVVGGKQWFCLKSKLVIFEKKHYYSAGF